MTAKNRVLTEMNHFKDYIIEIKESTPNGFEYVETIKFQLTQDKCDCLNAVM